MGHFPHLLTPLEDMTPSRQLAVLTHKLLSLLCHADMVRDRPCVVALALVSLELEQLAPKHWLDILNTLSMEELEAMQVRKASACVPGCSHLYAFTHDLHVFLCSRRIVIELCVLSLQVLALL
jgi:hypothetical protein